MSLKCPICGKEYLHDRKICHLCEGLASNSGLNTIEKRWRCDNFLESRSIVFGSRPRGKMEKTPITIKCNECGEEFSYGRHICHTCGSNSIPFGKLFEKECTVRTWNCDTTMACVEVESSDLHTIEAIVEHIPRVEKLEKTEYKWNNIKTNSHFQMDEKKGLLIYE